MVYVTHYADYGRTLLKKLVVLFLLLEEFCDDIHLFFHLTDDVILDGDILGILIGQL